MQLGVCIKKEVVALEVVRRNGDQGTTLFVRKGERCCIKGKRARTRVGEEGMARGWGLLSEDVLKK